MQVLDFGADRYDGAGDGSAKDLGKVYLVTYSHVRMNIVNVFEVVLSRILFLSAVKTHRKYIRTEGVNDAGDISITANVSIEWLDCNCFIL